MKVFKTLVGFLAFLILSVSLGILAGNQQSLEFAKNFAKIFSTTIGIAVIITAAPIIIFSFIISAYYGAVMSVSVKPGEKTRQAAFFGIKNMSYHPEIFTPAGLKARTEMAHWTIIFIISLSCAVLGYLYEVLKKI